MEQFLLEITKAEIVIKITGNSGIVEYDGDRHSVTGYDLSCTSGCSSFDESLLIFTGVAIVEETNVGKYLMGLTENQFSYNNNNNDLVTFEVEDSKLEITKVEIVIKITGHTGIVEYDGDRHSVAGYDLSCTSGCSSFDESLLIFTGMAIVEASDVGTYFMGLNVNQFGYDNNSINATFEVEDGKLEIKEES